MIRVCTNCKINSQIKAAMASMPLNADMRNSKESVELAVQKNHVAESIFSVCRKIEYDCKRIFAIVFKMTHLTLSGLGNQLRITFNQLDTAMRQGHGLDVV